MPRKRDIPKKKIIPDPIYKSTNVTRLTNMIMQDGKKRTAEKIVYEALSISSKKTKEEPLQSLRKRSKMLALQLKSSLGEWVVQTIKCLSR